MYTMPQGEGEERTVQSIKHTRAKGRLGRRGGEGKCSSRLSFKPVLSNENERNAKGKHRWKRGKGDPEREGRKDEETK